MKKLFEGNIRKNFFVFAFPLILTSLFTQSYNFINTYMAGHFLGDIGISSTGSISPFFTFISSMCWGYATGFSIYAAGLFGKSEYKKMLNVIKQNLLITSGIIILLAAVCILGRNVIFDFLNIEEAIRKETSVYFIIMMSGLVINHQVWCGVYISNAVGITFFPFLASILTSIMNISGNYILVKICGLGIAGIALATVISNTVAMVFYYIVLLRTFRKMEIPLSGVYFDKKEISISFKYGFPTMLQQSVMYICTTLVSPLTNSCGADAIAGYTIGMRFYDLNANIYQNSNKTVSNYIAQCVGAGKEGMIKKGIKTGLIQTLLFLAPFLAVTVIKADFFAELFLNGEESIHFATVFIRFCMPFVLFNVINNLLHAIFRSMGAGKYLVLATGVYSLSRWLFSLILYTRFGIYGIYAGTVLAWVTEAIYGMIIFFSGKWKSKNLKEF